MSARGKQLAPVPKNPFLEVPADASRFDVEEIGVDAFEFCQRQMEYVRRRRANSSVLIHGEPGSGKTQLMERLRRSWAGSVFIHLSCEGNSGGIWRSLRRQLIEDLTRCKPGEPSPLDRALLRRARGGYLDEWKSELREQGRKRLPADDRVVQAIHRIIVHLEESGSLVNLPGDLFDRLEGTRPLPADLAIVLGHLLYRRHYKRAVAWLKGDALRDFELETLGLDPSARQSTQHPEAEAREFVLNIAMLVEDKTPIIFCFDQVEALSPEFLSFGKALSALHDFTSHILTLTVMRTQYLPLLCAAMGGNYARLCGKQRALPPLTRSLARLLIEKRLAASLAWQTTPIRFEDFADLFSDSPVVTAKRVVEHAARLFDRAASGSGS